MARVINILNRGGGGGTEITVVANYSALPDPTTVSGEFYWAEASQGTSWLPGSLGGTYYNSGMYYSNGVSWTFMNVPYQATQAEVNTGTNTDKFVTPDTFTNASKWATKLDKSTPANTIKANNTGSTADVADFTFKQVASQTYGGTLTWTGTAPTGLTTTYTWSQIGNQVSFRFDIVATGTGTGVTALSASLPSDMPDPLIQSGKTGANAVLYFLTGVMQTSVSALTTAARSSCIRRNASDDGFNIVHAQGSINVGMVSISGVYFTD